MSDIKQKSEYTSNKGCIIEMDTVALEGIQTIYKIVQSELARMKIEIDEGLFARYLLGKKLEPGLKELLKTFGRQVPEAMAEKLRSAYLAKLAETPVAENQALHNFVQGLTKNNVRVGLLTQLGRAEAEQLFAPLLTLPNVTLLCEKPALVGGLTWDAWRRAAEKLEMNNRLCVALVTSSASRKAALAASLPVIAIPNEMTDYQDFTGAYACFDQLGESVLTEVLQALRI